MSYKPNEKPLTGGPSRAPYIGSQLEGADMKPFALEPNMLTMRGVFYPTGYMFLMFPTEQDARNAEHALEEDGYSGESISLLTSQDIQEKVARTVGNADIPLPSAGTEADTVRHFAQLASQGHCALMIHAPTGKETGHIMEVLKDAPISYGQKYRHLVIEDLVE
ncbi:RNA-binding protein [Ramlibacter sp. WS9]|uniref:RNA-binding protein n=1 Tax=Ramlibacter sp. WS9 TaxID=1882741 RepID=UPI001144D2F5|nr:RNA-binding protein [Ramlibacter sp. WS9]